MTISSILAWQQPARPAPDEADKSVAVGVHLEEFAEFLQTLRMDKEGYQMLLDRCISDLSWFAVKLKKGESVAFIPPHLRVEALDGLCDQIVTGVGVAYVSGFDIESALAEVDRSNCSKFVDGKPVFLDGKKVSKGPGYTPPDLKSFV